MCSSRVLSFTNLSADPDNEYFGDGLAEEIINLLAQAPELKVIARTSAFAFKGKQEDIRRSQRFSMWRTSLRGPSARPAIAFA